MDSRNTIAGPRFELRDAPFSNGRGIFAKASILIGSPVFDIPSQKALVLVPGTRSPPWDGTQGCWDSLMPQELAELDTEFNQFLRNSSGYQKDLIADIISRHAPCRHYQRRRLPVPGMLSDIFLASAILFNSSQGVFLGIGPYVSKVNHSCFPNAHLTFAEESTGPDDRLTRTANLQLFADENIEEGEEITVDYLRWIDDVKDKRSWTPEHIEKRAETLLSRHGFICHCSFCQLYQARCRQSRAECEEWQAYISTEDDSEWGRPLLCDLSTDCKCAACQPGASGKPIAYEAPLGPITIREADQARDRLLKEEEDRAAETKEVAERKARKRRAQKERKDAKKLLQSHFKQAGSKVDTPSQEIKHEAADADVQSQHSSNTAIEIDTQSQGVQTDLVEPLLEKPLPRTRQTERWSCPGKPVSQTRGTQTEIGQHVAEIIWQSQGTQTDAQCQPVQTELWSPKQRAHLPVGSMMSSGLHRVPRPSEAQVNKFMEVMVPKPVLRQIATYDLYARLRRALLDFRTSHREARDMALAKREPAIARLDIVTRPDSMGDPVYPPWKIEVLNVIKLLLPEPGLAEAAGFGLFWMVRKAMFDFRIERREISIEAMRRYELAFPGRWQGSRK